LAADKTSVFNSREPVHHKAEPLVPAKDFVASACPDLSTMPISLRRILQQGGLWVMDTRKHAVMHVSWYFDPAPLPDPCFR
jgi:hypothetical protein